MAAASVRRRVRHWWWLPLLLGAALAGIAVWVGALPAVFGPIIATDVNQTRLDTVPPAPQGDFVLRQPFMPRWNGLRDIELVLARPDEPAAEENGRLLLRLRNANDEILAEQTLATNTLSHNQTHTFHFPPQWQSAGQTHVLELAGRGDNRVSAWGYSLDVYEDGRFTIEPGPVTETAPETAVQEMRFVTRYQLTWQDALLELATMLYWQGGIVGLALLLIPLPGALLLVAGRRWWHSGDGAAQWGTAVALGVAAWPLLWFWPTLAGWRWTGWLLWPVLLVGWGAALFLWLRTRRIEGRRHPSPTPWRTRAAHLALLALLLVGLAVRLLAVRHVNASPWVDASRHALITAVMAETGQALLRDYAPVMPEITRFPYHFGFHTLSTGLHLMTGWSLPELLLFLGQLLNALVPLTVYTAVWLMVRRRGAALLGAFLVALPFFLPGYYVSWGRLTQLTAVLLLPVLLALTWLLLRGARRWQRAWLLVAVLAAGLCLIHFRVFLYYLPFVVVVWGISVGRNGRWLLAATTTALLLVGVRLYQLSQQTQPVAMLTYTISDYNAFPTQYYQAGWDRYFIWLAGGVVALALLAAVRRHRWSHLPLALAGWVAILFLLLSGQRLGLPETTLVNLNSMYIVLFVPLALLLAAGFSRLWRGLSRLHWLAQILGYGALGAALLVTGLFGVRHQITILNAQTVLAQPPDLAGIDWLASHAPADAKIAVNSWNWLGRSWAGSDGGAWIVPLTGLQTTTPPADYTYNADLLRAVEQFNQDATAVSDWSTTEAAAWLRQQNVSHVFVGARGGFFDPAALARNPEIEMVYGRDGVFIFEIGK